MARIATALLCGATLAAGALSAGAAAAPGGDGVLVIGDSLSVGGESQLEQALAGVPLTIDAEIGRPSAVGVEVLEATLGPGHGAVLFALGSNDDPNNPDALRANLERANAIAAGRCVVVATVEVEQYSGLEDAPLNKAIRAFAAANPNVRLVEWEEAATANPQMLSDGAHATPEGYALRAGLIADAIATCGAAAAAAAPGGGDGIPNPRGDVELEPAPRPDRSEERDDPEPPPLGAAPTLVEKRIDRNEAMRILADAVSKQIAIGALG